MNKLSNTGAELEKSVAYKKTCNIPVDTGRKLKVLCTFNLRPVSTTGLGEIPLLLFLKIIGKMDFCPNLKNKKITMAL